MTQYVGDQLSFVLPTHDIMRDLFEDLSMLSVADYDTTELLSISVSVLGVRNEALGRIAQTSGEYHRLAKIGRISEYNRDMEILSQAWLKFTSNLFKIYDFVNIWDERGCANLYFVRLLGNDMVVSAFPKVYPPE